MARQQENPVTSQLAYLLRNMSPGWELEEQQRPLEGSQRQPDIMVTRPGHQTVAIEAKWNDAAADGVEQVRSRYLGRRLHPDFVGISDTLRAAIVIRYPARLRNKRGATIQTLLKHAADLEYLLIGETGGEPYQFPSSGYARGTLADIATALQVGAVPSQRIDAAAERMEYDIHVAAKWLDASIANIPAIGHKLHDILEQAPGEQTSRMACLILTDAFVFQNALAGKDSLEAVRPLSYYKIHPMDWTKVIADWEAILAVNYQPIFKDAKRMVQEAFLYDEPMANKVLEKLWEAADTLVASHLPQLHELAGEVFQKLVVDRKYVKANYTLSTSAALLAALVCPRLPDDGTLPKVADFACGTGALLNGVYKRIQHLYEQETGKSSVTIHRHMLENNLAGTDIYSHCTHLTFAAMASAHPEVTLGATRVITAPYGLQADGTYKTGALELLDSQLLFDSLETEGEQVGGEGSAAAELKREFPDGEMDIVIINPPFAKNADANSKAGKAHFKGQAHSDEDEKLMRKALKKKDTRVANGNNGLGSYFVEMAHRKLKDGGTMGFILLSTILTGVSMSKLRGMLATEYHDVNVLTIASPSGDACAFSSDTSLAECIVVATKGIGESTGRAKFVCMSERPDSLLLAQTLAELVQRQSVTRRLEDTPNGGEPLMVGDVCIGQVLDCPIDEREWGLSRVLSFSLMQTAYHLSQGQLHLPQLLDATDIPVCQLSDFSEIGYNASDIKDESRGDGAFVVREQTGVSYDGYTALWKVQATLQRSMMTHPNATAQIQPGKEEKARRILKRNSRTHYHINLGYPANSVIASWTEHPAIGVRSMTNVALEDSRYEAAWTLWCNSTLGLLCHWMHSGKQQAGRGIMKLKALRTLPTLNIRQLSDEQLAAADAVFSDLKTYRMKPYNECATDAWRHVLDARLLSEVLGITDAEVHRGMQRLREMLCVEPSITGMKRNPADLAAEREKHHLPGSEVADKAALAREQRALVLRGIPLFEPALS